MFQLFQPFAARLPMDHSRGFIIKRIEYPKCIASGAKGKPDDRTRFFLYDGDSMIQGLFYFIGFPVLCLELYQKSKRWALRPFFF